MSGFESDSGSVVWKWTEYFVAFCKEHVFVCAISVEEELLVPFVTKVSFLGMMI